MDKNELEIIDDNRVAKVLNLDEFRNLLLNDCDEQLSFSGDLSDFYLRIPNFIRKLSNIDPTGALGYLDGLLTDNKAKREQERLHMALHYMYQTFLEFGNEMKQFMEKDKYKASIVTELYFEKSKESYQEEKVNYLKLVWINSILNYERKLDEKEYVFQLVSSLSVDQIRVIKVVYKGVEEKISIFGEQTEDETELCLLVKEISQSLNLDNTYTQQICTDLHGRGLLRYPRGGFINGEPAAFLTTSIVELLNIYLNETDADDMKIVR